MSDVTGTAQRDGDIDLRGGETAQRVNEYGQPIGEAVEGWEAPPYPAPVTLTGRLCSLEPVNVVAHADDLSEAYAEADDARDWTYLPHGPFTTADEYREWLAEAAASRDPLHFAVIDRETGRAVGTLSLLRQHPEAGSIEVGWVVFSRRMQRRPISTEAQFLLMRHVFDDLGYRRYEWKCDALNAPSRRAAARLGFTFEGTFRKATITKGRSRDTAWFALTDDDWPRVREAFTEWLDPSNFDANGIQRQPLSTT